MKRRMKLALVVGVRSIEDDKTPPGFPDGVFESSVMDLSIDLDRDRISGESGKLVVTEFLVVGFPDVLEDLHGNFFAEEQPFGAVGAVVHTGEVAANGYVVRELVQLVADGEVGPGVGLQCGSIGIRIDLHGEGDDPALVEEGLQRGDAGAGDDSVSSGIGRVRR